METSITDARDRQEELGQFLTPEPVAEFMASLFETLPSTVRLLDAGAGAGALTRAFVSRICDNPSTVRTIEATLYEFDSHIQESLLTTLQECQRLCSSVGIHFIFTIHKSDFIQEMSSCLAGNLFGSTPPCFDAAIANPPYRKIGSNSKERRWLSDVGVETSNLYTGFIALISRLLAPGGQLVGITPRSFCNGPYFRPFREDFLERLELRRLHVFESRKAAFRTDSVLQENIIFHVVKGGKQPRQLIISTSSGEDGAEITEAIVPFVEIVHPQDSGKFIHIPSTTSHGSAKKSMEHFTSNLNSLGVTVSTGRVVDFRMKQSLRKESEPGTVPLVYPCHFNGGTVHWPKENSRKPNAIVNNSETRQWLVPSGVYLLTKRFTSKEERRRLVACLYDPTDMSADWVGFENHLNYFHSQGHGLDRHLAVGLYIFLNSTVVDQYFRRFSGHTQVNATDLRNLAYPSAKTLKMMGRATESLDLEQDEIDCVLKNHFHDQ